jgi:nucleoid-associated protein YgaU
VVKDLSRIGEVTSVQPLTAAAKDANRKAKSSGSALPKIYVVIDGDSLAVIAMKVYGYQHGNKRINITRIFQANRGILKSPDEIYVDQRLVIPPLSESQSGEDKIERLFCPASFERAESTGQRQIVTDSGQAEENRRHVVQEGDSLWQIAAEQLSDGTRYHEIAELNSGILEDEDNLVIGMCLKLPRR